MKTRLHGVALRPRTGLGPRQLQKVLDMADACDEGRTPYKGLTLAAAWRRASLTHLAWWLVYGCGITNLLDITGRDYLYTDCVSNPKEQKRLATLIRATYRYDGTRKDGK